ncbi:hypothetical protein L208DRAFT_1374452 [Tricholoma matsutake]|nr:hypothetical protein L208DRAFT_1374452 [Tricholoma matsutake 945]
MNIDEGALFDYLLTLDATAGDGKNFKLFIWTGASVMLAPLVTKSSPKTASYCKNKWGNMKKIFAIIKAIRASQAGCGVMKQAHLLITQLLTAGMPMPPDASMGPDGTGGESQGGETQGGETLGQGNNFMEDSQAASQTPPDNPEEPRSQTKSNSIGIGIIEMSYACNCYTCISEEALIIGTGHIIGKHHSINAGIQ